MKMTSVPLATLAGVLLAISSAPVAAATFDFEDVAPNMYTAAPVPDGYAGAHWSGFVLRRSSDFWNSSSGGFVLNGTTMALHTSASPTIAFAAPVRFDGAFVGSYGVGSPSTISYTLWLDGDQVSSSGPLGYSTGYVATGYAGPVDRIEFHVGASDRLSLDDLNVSAVPEPARWGLMAGGLAALVWRRRRA